MSPEDIGRSFNFELNLIQFSINIVSVCHLLQKLSNISYTVTPKFLKFFYEKAKKDKCCNLDIFGTQSDSPMSSFAYGGEVSEN